MKVNTDIIHAYQNLFQGFDAFSRIWIFPSETDLTSTQKQQIEHKLRGFIGVWQAHGEDLTADFCIFLDRFIIVTVDEKKAAATGCSIDKLTKLIQELEKETGASLLNRMLVHYLESNQLKSVHFSKMKKLKEDASHSNSPIHFFDTSVGTLKDFQEAFLS